MKMSPNFLKLSQSANFIGREHELTRLNSILSEDDSSITVVHGRRRVGKTALIEAALSGRRALKFEGLEGKSVSQQRRAFLEELSRYCSDINIARLNLKSWKDVFIVLAEKIAELENVVIYFEELQWLANYRHDLVSDLKYVWDNYFSKLKGLKLILCGSATSFMLGKVVRSRALYSRSLYEVPVEPFSLRETKKFLSTYSDTNALDAYLLVGGIPEYLRYFKNNTTPLQTLQNEAFAPGGYFVAEFERVFTSSLAKFEQHKQVILAFSKKGFFSRSDLAKVTRMSEGGSFTNVLNDLELIGLIAKFKGPYCGKSRYYLKDPYLNFYLKFILPKIQNIRAGQYKKGFAEALDLDRLQQHLGYSFERFCREKHFDIARILGISGIQYTYGPYGKITKSGDGFQFDLVFDRKDRCLSLFELKCRQMPLGIEVATEFEKKLRHIEIPRTHNIQKVLVTSGPVSKSLKDAKYFNRIIELDEIVNEF
jgi:uncharacterized protein